MKAEKDSEVNPKQELSRHIVGLHDTLADLVATSTALTYHEQNDLLIQVRSGSTLADGLHRLLDIPGEQRAKLFAKTNIETLQIIVHHAQGICDLEPDGKLSPASNTMINYVQGRIDAMLDKQL